MEQQIEVLGTVQAGRGREEVNDAEKQEKDKHEETDERSSTHHGWHEVGTKRTQARWVVRLEPSSEYAHNQTCKLHEKNSRVKCICPHSPSVTVDRNQL